MLIETLMICSLITTAPYYDCGEMWELNMYNTRHLDYNICRDERPKILGCAFYSKNSFVNKLIPPEIHLGTGNDYRDEWGMNTLQHEIKHIQCRCAFDE